MDLLSQSKTLKEVLHRPLIVGASVSGDHLALSPGKRLALRHTDRHNIHVVAKNGSPGRETLKSLQAKDLEGRSIVIAVDLFFWDSTLAHPQISLQALHHFVGRLTRLGIPLLLGDIPELLPGWQQSRKLIHDEIHRLCHHNPLCWLLPLEHLYKEVLQAGFLKYQGHQYNLWDLVPDGLHIGEVAGNYLADVMSSILAEALVV